MAGNYLLNVSKLKDRENYDNWVFAAENFLILEGIHINDVTKKLEAADDEKAKAKLIMTIDPSLYVHVRNEKTVRALWTKLKSLFHDSGYTRRISLLRSLISVRLESSDSMTSYVTQIIETAQKLKGTCFKINDEWVGALLLAGLPESFEPMIMVIEHLGMSVSSDVIKTNLLDMNSDVGNVGNESAFLSRKHTQRKFARIKSTIRDAGL